MVAQRLYLRNFVPADAERLFEIEREPEMVRFQNFPARTLESAAAYVREDIEEASKDSPRWTEFAVCLKETHELIGRVGGSPDKEAPTVIWIWYVIAGPHQGQGFAVEACRLLLSSLAGFSEVRIECDPANEASCRVAERLGFSLVSERAQSVTIEGRLCDSRVYALSLA